MIYRQLLVFAALVTANCFAMRAMPDEPERHEAQQAHIAIFDDQLPGVAQPLAAVLAEQLRREGLTVTCLTAAQACDGSQLAAERHFLYIVPHCRTYPAGGLDVLVTYVQGGGHALFLGGPLLDDPIWYTSRGWLNRESVSALRQAVRPAYEPFPEAVLNTVGWKRQCSDSSIPGNWESVPEGPHGQTCFRFTTAQLALWDGYLSHDVHVFGPGHNLLVFMARGSDRTRQVAVEIQEEDGSRWIAVAALGPQWQRIALDMSDFKYWPDAAAPARRDAPGDHLRPDQARRVCFQLARSHTTELPAGEHAFWIAQIGTCQDPATQFALTEPAATRSLESIYPRYKVYPLHDPLRVETAAPFLKGRGDVCGEQVRGLVCAIPRTMGRGFQRQAKWRYIPLAHATDSQGRQRGNPAWLLLECAEQQSTSVLACLGWNDARCLTSTQLLRTVQLVVERLRDGVFLQEAGAQHFAYWPGETVILGATVTGRGTSSQQTSLRLTLTDGSGRRVFDEANELLVPARATVNWQTSFRLPDAAPPGVWQVRCELTRDRRVVDHIDHTITLLNPAAPDRRDFVRVAGGDFYIGDRKWYPVGVNYWPLYVSGMEHQDFWAGWLQRPYYDPQLIEQDLARLKSLGVNLVSIQANEPEHYRNLLDFLERCRRHELRVNLFCGLASPLDFREQQLRDFIAVARLDQNPTVMAYDTIWEPGNYVFGHDWRARWDGDWQDWLVEQYGSVAEAEKDWEYACPRGGDGAPTSPPSHCFREDGPWRGLLAAYRRFMDDLMSRRWNQARRRLLAIDPNHLISFRQGNTLPHDFTFTATAKHVDFVSPEGYAIEQTEEGYAAAGFITRYVHFTTRGKPILWAEFGKSIWDPERMEPSPERAKEVAQYHDMFYRMVLESGANGTAPWWWPGGYRVGEQSDYGIVNPDGTPRPAALLIRHYAPRLTAERSWPPPTTWLNLDRDAHAGGYWHACFHAGQKAYREAVAQGGQLGIRTDGTDTDSASTPLVAVGNRPCNGQNPPKYLNAEFNWLQIQDATGAWVPVHEGDTVAVTGDVVRARISLGNTQEAAWLAPGPEGLRVGDVLLVTTSASELRGQWPLPHATPYLADVDFGEIELARNVTQPVRVELRLAAHQRCEFGEKRACHLQPAPR